MFGNGSGVGAFDESQKQGVPKPKEIVSHPNNIDLTSALRASGNADEQGENEGLLINHSDGNSSELLGDFDSSSVENGISSINRESQNSEGLDERNVDDVSV
ncbi:hypothetical protein GCM10007877_03930 [Marinibactrum halimedae]|uniref:Uncharacterized protein n=2 Tax=Marinibactrum halimedae TaxID=1444977 RepID=A0AA37WKM8_9GAMM|nr:hypothetical protein GCM10007877_03930 [Marinibactrum halimedae]